MCVTCAWDTSTAFSYILACTGTHSVTDGRLTLSGALGSSTKINYIKLSSAVISRAEVDGSNTGSSTSSSHPHTTGVVVGIVVAAVLIAVAVAMVAIVVFKVRAKQTIAKKQLQEALIGNNDA